MHSNERSSLIVTCQ